MTTVPNVPATDPLLSGTKSRAYVKAISESGTVWTEANRVPINSELTFTPTGSIQSVPVFGEDFDRAVKTGRGGTLSLMTLAPANDETVTVLLDASEAVSGDARVRVLIVNPDLRAYVGIAVVESAVPRYDNRNVFGYQISATMDGEYKPFTFTENMITSGG